MVIMAAAALPASAQEAGTTDHISVEMDAGFLSDYDDSGLWEQGYIAGVAGLWSLNASTALCVRFGISHWSYVPDSVVLDLVPPSAELTFQQSSGQIEVLALTPMIRWSSWLEVIPVCHVIFAEETANVFGISVGFRVRV